MIKTLVPYGVAFFAALVVAPLLELPSVFIFAWASDHNKKLAPVISFFAGFLTLSTAMSLFIVVCHRFQIQASFLMFFLPYLALGYNNFRRIFVAMLNLYSIDEKRDHEGHSNATIVLKMESCHLLGDSFGLWLPLFAWSVIQGLPIKFA